MAIIGFNFRRIVAERGAATGNIKIDNNIAITDIKATKVGADEKRKSVRISFRFVSKYEPKAAQILLDGDVILLEETKLADELVNGWAKEKKLPTVATMNVMNHVLERCNVQALILSRDLNLPSPIPLPKVNMQTVPPGAKPKKAGAGTAAKTDGKKAKPKKSKKK